MHPKTVWLAIALLSAGCAHTVGGAARPVDSAVALLPSEDEFTQAVGNRLSTFGFPPFVGGTEILPNGYRTESDASPIGCIAVTDTATRAVYEPTPVTEAARQSYFNWDEGVDISGADAAAVRMSSADAAARTYDTFVRRWQQCDGTTVEKRLRGANNTEISAAISDVTVTGSVVTATVRTGQGRQAAVYQRALGVRGDAIVEVSLGLTRSGAASAENREKPVRAAQAMQDRVS